MTVDNTPMTPEESKRLGSTDLYQSYKELSEHCVQVDIDAEKPEGVEFCTWFLIQRSKLDVAKKHTEDLIKSIIEYFVSRGRSKLSKLDRQQAWLNFNYGAEFQLAVQRDLEKQGGKAKSIDYIIDRAGFRTSPMRVEIDDEDAAIDDLQKICPAALRTSVIKSALRKLMKDGGEIPAGCRMAGGEHKFFPDITVPEDHGNQMRASQEIREAQEQMQALQEKARNAK